MTYVSSQARTILDRTLAKGVTMKAIAEKSNVSIRTVSRLRNGHAVSELSALAVMNGLGVIWVERREARLAKQEAAETLHDKVEQLAAERADCADWDTDLECAKYRRVMQLEKELEQTKAEVGVWRKKADKAGLRACDLDLLVQRRDAELSDANTAYLMSKSQHDRDLQLLHNAQDVLAQREQHLKSCENALIEANEKIQNVLDESGKQLADLSLQLYGANAEIKRLTALSETHGQSWKAACVQAEQLQKQLDHSNQKINELYAQYSQQVDDEREMLAQIDKLFAERDNMRTKYARDLMEIRTYTWAMFAALVFVVASGLVVWGAK